EVTDGETLAVLGRSGTGKSVLLKLLVGLQSPDSGVIRIHGQEMKDLDLKQLNDLRQRIGFLFQSAALYDSMTVEENVAFPLRRRGKGDAGEQTEKVGDLLRSVGMEQHG